MLKLGITRDAKQLVLLKQEADKRDIDIIPLPVIKTKSLITAENQIPDLQDFDWLFFSSANGVHVFFEYLDKQLLPHSIKIAVVGNKTADAIKSYGIDTHFQPTKAYGKNLFGEFKEMYNNEPLRILYLRAEEINYDPRDLFFISTIDYFEINCYKSEENAVNKSDIEKLTESDYLLFTAPSTVSSYENQFGKPKAKLIAIGNTTKDAIEHNNWKTEIILDKPEIDKVLEYI